MRETNDHPSKPGSDETIPDDHDLKQIRVSLEKRAIQNSILRKMISHLKGASEASSTSLKPNDKS
jgi:hypothetical protein